MNDRYALFDARLDSGKTWEDVYNIYRPQINDSTDNTKLFEVGCKMINELRDDNHVLMVIKADGNTNKCYAPTEMPEYPFNDSTMIRSTLNTLKNYQFSNLQYDKKKAYGFSSNSNYGYLYTDYMFAHNRHIDEFMEEFRNLEGLIIDLRNNKGGNANSVYQLVNRFADKKRVGGIIETRKKGTNTFKKDTLTIRPKGSYQFNKPIVVLISDVTSSAAERVAMCFQELPNVTLMGDTTYGTFSEQWEYRVSKGWWVYYSSQKVNDANNKLVEAEGIIPEIYFTNKEEDWKDGYDEAIEKAIELLKTKK
jgi:carboxyl-terminal processing protease